MTSTTPTPRQASHAELGITLLDTFTALLDALGTFGTALRDDDRPLWIALSDGEQADGVSERDKALTLYQTLWYEDGQDGRETLTCPGVVGACEHTLDAAATLNRAKDRFKDAVQALKQLPKADAERLLADLHARHDDVNRAMRRMGAARLNLKQAYRHVPLLDRRPAKIGFTWSKQGRTIQRTTVAEARRLLERRAESAAVDAELAKLAALPEDEILARVRTTVPHVRANLLFNAAPDDPDGEPERRLMQAPLPILLPLAAGETLPVFVPVPATPGGQQRNRRSDVKIEDEPFVPLLRIHRYQPAYR